jgi:hypothetical protein
MCTDKAETFSTNMQKELAKFTNKNRVSGLNNSTLIINKLADVSVQQLDPHKK